MTHTCKAQVLKSNNRRARASGCLFRCAVMRLFHHKYVKIITHTWKMEDFNLMSHFWPAPSRCHASVCRNAPCAVCRGRGARHYWHCVTLSVRISVWRRAGAATRSAARPQLSWRRKSAQRLRRSRARGVWTLKAHTLFSATLGCASRSRAPLNRDGTRATRAAAGTPHSLRGREGRRAAGFFTLRRAASATSHPRRAMLGASAHRARQNGAAVTLRCGLRARPDAGELYFTNGQM